LQPQTSLTERPAANRTPMNRSLRILMLFLTLACAGAWQPSAYAGRLATLDGQADAEQVNETQEFKLAEQAQVEVGYVIDAVGQGCNVHIRISRQLPNGSWSVVSTPGRITSSSRGGQSVLLSAGDYRVEVIARNASFTVTVDK